MTSIEMCRDCTYGYYHDYNGVWLCQSCGQPKEKPDPEPVTPADRPPARPVRRKKVSDE